MYMSRIAGSLIALLLIVVAASHPLAHADGSGETSVSDDGQGAFSGYHSASSQRKANHSVPSKRSTSTTSPASSSSTPCSPGDPGSGECFPYFKLLNPGLTSAGAESIARSLVVRLQLPDPTPQFGPDPADNEWNMAAVGYPLWLWTNGPRTVTSTTSASGMSFTLRARYRFTTFTLGDGHSLTCTSTTPYRTSIEPGAPSPTCGYRYTKASGTDHSYTVTATTHWTVTWRVAGFSGSLPGTHTASRQLRVGELQAVVVG